MHIVRMLDSHHDRAYLQEIVPDIAVDHIMFHFVLCRSFFTLFALRCAWAAEGG